MKRLLILIALVIMFGATPAMAQKWGKQERDVTSMNRVRFGFNVRVLPNFYAQYRADYNIGGDKEVVK